LTLKLTERKDGVEFSVKLKPRSSRNAVLGVREGVLECAVNAPPVDGRANEALIALLSEHLGIPPKALEISGGAKSRNKRVLVARQFVQIMRVPGNENADNTP
jgi:uncharacterized protein (TIGR00251 family)